MKAFSRYYLVIASLFLITTSCSDDSGIESIENIENSISIKDSTRVDLSEIKRIASSLYLNKNSKKKDNEIAEITPIGTDLTNPSYYIINYQNGGFLILSGDKRMFPVLAYSNTNNFDTKAEAYPDLLVSWLKQQDEKVRKMREDTVIMYPEIQKQWEVMNIQNYVSEDNQVQQKSTESCGSLEVGESLLVESYGPLLNTRWGQGEGYNNQAPDYNCTRYDNGKTATGCVATAMAQIMRFHEYPNNYNWSIMPNAVTTSNMASNGVDEIARLMRDSGNSVGMDWGCDGSSASTGDADNALISSFGYTSADYMGFSSSTLGNEVKNGYPVILKGGEKVTKWLIFDTYQKGHAWVSDGYRRYKVVVLVNKGRWGPQPTCVNGYNYHMNWGWNGFNNGWYSSLSVDDYDFTYESKMVYNIRK